MVVQSLADGTRWRVAAGSEAHWGGDGQALFLVGPEGDVEFVAIRRTADGFSFERPVRLFAPNAFVNLRNGVGPARYGQLFVVTTTVVDPPQPVSVVLNWRPGQ